MQYYGMRHDTVGPFTAPRAPVGMVLPPTVQRMRRRVAETQRVTEAERRAPKRGGVGTYLSSKFLSFRSNGQRRVCYAPETTLQSAVQGGVDLLPSPRSSASALVDTSRAELQQQRCDVSHTNLKALRETPISWHPAPPVEPVVPDVHAVPAPQRVKRSRAQQLSPVSVGEMSPQQLQDNLRRVLSFEITRESAVGMLPDPHHHHTATLATLEAEKPQHPASGTLAAAAAPDSESVCEGEEAKVAIARGSCAHTMVNSLHHMTGVINGYEAGLKEMDFADEPQHEAAAATPSSPTRAQGSAGDKTRSHFTTALQMEIPEGPSGATTLPATGSPRHLMADTSGPFKAGTPEGKTGTPSSSTKRSFRSLVKETAKACGAILAGARKTAQRRADAPLEPYSAAAFLTEVDLGYFFPDATEAQKEAEKAKVSSVAAGSLRDPLLLTPLQQLEQGLAEVMGSVQALLYKMTTDNDEEGRELAAAAGILKSEDGGGLPEGAPDGLPFQSSTVENNRDQLLLLQHHRRALKSLRDSVLQVRDFYGGYEQRIAQAKARRASRPSISQEVDVGTPAAQRRGVSGERPTPQWEGEAFSQKQGTLGDARQGIRQQIRPASTPEDTQSQGNGNGNGRGSLASPTAATTAASAAASRRQSSSQLAGELLAQFSLTSAPPTVGRRVFLDVSLVAPEKLWELHPTQMPSLYQKYVTLVRMAADMSSAVVMREDITAGPQGLLLGSSAPRLDGSTDGTQRQGARGSADGTTLGGQRRGRLSVAGQQPRGCFLLVAEGAVEAMRLAVSLQAAMHTVPWLDEVHTVPNGQELFSTQGAPAPGLLDLHGAVHECGGPVHHSSPPTFRCRIGVACSAAWPERDVSGEYFYHGSGGMQASVLGGSAYPGETLCSPEVVESAGVREYLARCGSVAKPRALRVLSPALPQHLSLVEQWDADPLSVYPPQPCASFLGDSVMEQASHNPNWWLPYSAVDPSLLKGYSRREPLV